MLNSPSCVALLFTIYNIPERQKMYLADMGFKSKASRSMYLNKKKTQKIKVRPSANS